MPDLLLANTEHTPLRSRGRLRHQRREKYQGLPPGDITPVAIETLGAIGPKSMVFFEGVGTSHQGSDG